MAFIKAKNHNKGQTSQLRFGSTQCWLYKPSGSKTSSQLIVECTITHGGQESYSAILLLKLGTNSPVKQLPKKKKKNHVFPPRYLHSYKLAVKTAPRVQLVHGLPWENTGFNIPLHCFQFSVLMFSFHCFQTFQCYCYILSSRASHVRQVCQLLLGPLEKLSLNNFMRRYIYICF